MRYLYQLGLDHEEFKQYIEAIECYRQSIELGYGRSAYRAGMIYTTVQGLIDYSIALPYLLKAHELGSRDEGKVCFNLAILYEKGLGTSKNKNLALDFYKLALQNGINDAQKQIQRLINQI